MSWTVPIRHPQPVQLPLGSRFHGQVPIELSGSTVFPAIGLRPYLLTLPGYASYWFRITPARRRRRSTATTHGGIMPAIRTA